MNNSKNNMLPSYDAKWKLSLVGKTNGLKLTSKEYKQHTRSQMNSVGDGAVIIFMDKHMFPQSNSGHQGNLFQSHTSSGRYIPNPMPEGSGIFQTVRKSITAAEFNGLDTAGKDHVDVVVANNRTTYFIERQEYYPDPWVGKESDPLSYPRARIMPSQYNKIAQAEVDFKDRLEAYCRWFVDKTVDDSLKRRCLDNEDLQLAIRNCRPDHVEAIIIAMVANHHGSIVEKCQMTEKSGKEIIELLNMVYKDHMDPCIFSEIFVDGVAAVEEQGVNQGKKTEGEDTLDYLYGMAFIRAFNNSKFSSVIDRARQDGLIKAPTCTLSWAVSKIKLWNDTMILANNSKRSAGKLDDGSKQAAKIQKLQAVNVENLATIARLEKFNHGDQANKNKNKTNNSKKGGGNGSTVSSSVKTVTGCDGNSYVNRICKNCKMPGHYDGHCPDLSEEGRVAAKAAFVATLPKKK